MDLLSDLLAVAIALVAFLAFVALIDGLERV
jgi:preprotein translocase subunit SecE